MVNKIFSAFVTQKVSQAKRFSCIFVAIGTLKSGILFQKLCWLAGLSSLFEKIVLGIKKNFSNMRGSRGIICKIHFLSLEQFLSHNRLEQFSKQIKFLL